MDSAIAQLFAIVHYQGFQPTSLIFVNDDNEIQLTFVKAGGARRSLEYAALDKSTSYKFNTVRD